MPIRDLIASKKFLVALIASVAAAGAHFGLNIDQSWVLVMVTPLWVYIFGQGIADHGKEAVLAQARLASGKRKGADPSPGAP